MSGDEIQRFRAVLFFLGLDQSTTGRAVCSWTLFVFFTAVVPAVETLWSSCETCDEERRHPFHRLVEYGQSAFAAVAFLCLSTIIQKFGLRKVLLLDRIDEYSVEVRRSYEVELNNSFKLLLWILLPCFVVELTHKIWLFRYIYFEFPFHMRDPLFDIFMCAGNVLAWLYKSTVFLFVCVLFRLLCSLQLLRLREYIKLVEGTTDVLVILQEHLRIREQLSIISHRFRVFLVLSIFLITFSQLYSLLVISDSQDTLHFMSAGDLLVCSAVQLSGFVICVYGAVKITHRAQELNSVVTQWHAVVTCNYKPSMYSAEPAQTLQGGSSDLEAPLIPSKRPAQNPMSIEEFYKRESLVNYLQHSKSGISLFGYTLDRGFLYAVFGIELTLTTFILGETLLHE
ncbi:hypothetical protein MPTK1_5g06410 [Marchantia polymorpha subsp. ruderalis]|uniref:Uncharacterized protein n=2 Tax=Marchantia polymorpha TaxID=3197 RepID=A0AAF6BFK0_MARPO|nr:hypothetical protein MARPO_0189s0013 [Marchantia polymorpha]BBN10784.1 hypothetical protein Mp_5g06410 [Marchantia polymorpha subsp. ruderalis]|eukprot:PTQ27640.1 hypothetical protein MARPO_0189s0013 [Marchantia polymorpha]